MHVLLTNDDGIYAEGLRALYHCLSRRHTVTVVAPDRERSAVGHGITLHQPLRTTRVSSGNGFRGVAVDGTPVDCVKLAVLALLDEQPDMVVSGINMGANVGVNINYSGTVAAAREGAIYGLPAIAASVQGNGRKSYDDAAEFVCRLMEKTPAMSLPMGTVLNINMPDIPLDQAAGVRFTRQDQELFDETIEKRIDPRNRPYFWQGCDVQRYTDPEADGAALGQRFITITPIICDATDYGILQTLKAWENEI